MIEIKIGDKEYPEILRKIKNPPNQLYAVGNINLLYEKSIAIVGSRCCSEYGIRMCEKFARELIKNNICIISGMAKGIDSIAHKECLKNGGKTIAVLGSGFNYIYPKENKELFKDIIKNNGLIVTEYEQNIEPNSKNFPERNRIVSGLSIGILVIEAAYRSGTTITAKYAKQQKKKVFCIPNSIDSIYSVGTNNLIKKGAKLITKVEDILEEYDFLKNKVQKIENNKDINEKNNIQVKEEYKEVYLNISREPIDINTLSKKTKVNISDISYILTMLEMEGIIERLPGNRFKRSMF